MVWRKSVSVPSFSRKTRNPRLTIYYGLHLESINLLLVFTKVCYIVGPDCVRVGVLTSFSSMLKCYLFLEPATVKSQCKQITYLLPALPFLPNSFYLLTQSMLFLKLFSACFIPLDWKVVPQRFCSQVLCS